MLPGACFAISIPRVSTTRSMDRKHEAVHSTSPGR